MPPRRPRHVRTRRTQVWLSEEAHAQIKGWATRQGLSVSAGIEALARLGLHQAPADALGPAVGRVAARTVRAEVAALRALFAATALEAAQTRRLATAILRHLPSPDRPRPAWAAQTRTWVELARRDAVEGLLAGDALRELGLGAQIARAVDRTGADAVEAVPAAAPDDFADEPDDAAEEFEDEEDVDADTDELDYEALAPYGNEAPAPGALW
jgi:hypothetical protein